MHKGKVVLNGQAETDCRAAKLKGALKMKRDPDFLKGVEMPEGLPQRNQQLRPCAEDLVFFQQPATGLSHINLDPL